MARVIAFLLAVMCLATAQEAIARGRGGGASNWGGGSRGGRAPVYRPYKAPEPARIPLPSPYRHPRDPDAAGRLPRTRPAPLPQSRPANEYREYRREVDRLSNQNYRQHRQQIDPARLRGERAKMDLDHATPVKRCYEQGLPPERCADPSNLRLMDAHQNRSEGCRGCKR